MKRRNHFDHKNPGFEVVPVQMTEDKDSGGIIVNNPVDDNDSVSSPVCIPDTESYAFLIVWSLLNYLMNLIFAIILLSWCDISKRSNNMRKTLLELIRDANMHDQEGIDLVENAYDQVKDEINRRQSFVRTLHEFGIFLMPRGITNNF